MPGWRRQTDADRIIEGVKGIMVAVSEVPFIRAPDPARCSAYIAALAARYPQVITITLIDASATPICANTPIKPGATAADRLYFQEALRKDAFEVGDYIE